MHTQIACHTNLVYIVCSCYVCRVSRHALHSSVRNRVVQGMKSKLPRKEQGVILLQGGGPAHVYSTDAEAVFRCYDLGVVQLVLMCSGKPSP